jgi:hypothetical protein
MVLMKRKKKMDRLEVDIERGRDHKISFLGQPHQLFLKLMKKLMKKIIFKEESRISLKTISRNKYNHIN